MLESLHRSWKSQIAVLFFIGMSVWWFYIFFSGFEQTSQNYLFAVLYGLICLWGSFWGFLASKKWGGFSSVVGRGIFALSLGLLAQEFGQIVFSYYNVFLKVEIPYPSIADVGFFGSVILYIWASLLLAKAAGARFSLKTFSSQVQAFLIPALMLSTSYFLFLRNYSFDFTLPLKIILDFSYPLGQAIYVSLAILTYSLSRKLLGGIMKSRILFIIIALSAQYLSDSNFLYQNLNSTWVNGGYGDYIYFASYFLMTLGLIDFKSAYTKIEES